MNIQFPNLSQTDIDHAFACLEDCKQPDAAAFGFHHPYFTPGGHYGKQWWQLDSALALGGYKWKDRKFVETALLNFIESQQPDGRICLWGANVLPDTVAGGNVLQQTHDVSSLPKIFDVAYHILKGSTDASLKLKTYHMLKCYLDWWFSHRLDTKTGLLTAVFEETFIPYLGKTGEYAPVDTNVEVYVGCHYTALLARELGKLQDAESLEARKVALKNSINTYLWNDEKGAYYPYSVKDQCHVDLLMASTFYPLRLCIADAPRKDRLLELLTADEHFNWNTLPLTSVSKQDPQFTTTQGEYKGNASWSGNVWTLINEMVVRGLLDSGENTLAAELSMKTLHAFKGKCSEFVDPFDASPHGVQKYAWSASHWLQLLIEVIFGIQSDAERQELSVTPHLPNALQCETLAITDVEVLNGVTADITIENGTVRCNVSDPAVTVRI